MKVDKLSFTFLQIKFHNYWKFFQGINIQFCNKYTLSGTADWYEIRVRHSNKSFITNRRGRSDWRNKRCGGSQIEMNFFSILFDVQYSYCLIILQGTGKIWLEVLKYIFLVSPYTLPSISYGVLKWITGKFPKRFYTNLGQKKISLKKQFEVTTEFYCNEYNYNEKKIVQRCSFSIYRTF